MAVRSYGIRLPGGAATTATIALAMVFCMLAGVGPEAAAQQWDLGSPTSSVVVESGVTPGLAVAGDSGVAIASDGMNGGLGEGVPPDDGTAAFAGDGFCSACNGAGCYQCRSTAIFDLIGDHCHDKTGCWIGRVDALLLWRNAPPGPAIVGNPLIPEGALNATGMESLAAAGPRFSILRVNKCTGNAIEATYLRAANFRSLRPLSELTVPYELVDPGIYGNTGLTFDSANADLGARVQSFEFNRHQAIFPSVRFLAGFRWIEWQEQFSMQANSIGGVSDYFQTNCINDLYGGQIGLDANLLSTRWIRFDSVVKAGAYYNNAVQSSLYTTNDPLNPGTASVTVGQSPLSGAFAGEVGLTGVIPITCCLDIRIGYFGLWLSGIAQPTQQLAGQQLTPGQPAVGTINSNGGVLLQGVSIGLEGRW